MKVTIITVVFNAENTIKHCIESVLAQDFNTIEYIIIDGQSTDGTLSVIKSYQDRISRIVSEKDGGIYDAMNKGIELASGEIIGILNADDVYAYNSVISDVVEVFENQKVDGVYGDLVYINSLSEGKIKRKWISGSYYKDAFLWGWMPPHPTFFVRKECYQKFGGFRLNLGSAADYELMLRFIHKHGISLHYLPKIMIKMCMGGASNATLENRILANQNDRRAWKINSLKPYFFTLALKPARKMFQFFKLAH